MERLVVLIVPGFLGVVSVFEEDRGGVPVQLFLRHKGAALKDEDALAGLREMERERAAACAGANDDCVVRIRHATLDARSGGIRCEFSPMRFGL
jgi:hypothetical protein